MTRRFLRTSLPTTLNNSNPKPTNITMNILKDFLCAVLIVIFVYVTLVAFMSL